MSDMSSLMSFYADKEIPPASSEFWEQRRRFAAQVRALQEQVQTTELTVEGLKALNSKLETLLQETPAEPRLEGRQAWIDSKKYGDFGTLHTEITSVVGPANPITPGLSIWFEGDKAYGSLSFSWIYEGNSKIAHGGWIAAVFDEFLGTAQVLSGKTGMTGSLTVSYFKPTPLNQELRLEGYLKESDGRKATVVAEMWAGDVMTASCEGLFIVPSSQKGAFLGG
jgi:hypothetical protein